MAEEKKPEVGFGKCAFVSHEGFDVGGAILEIEAGKKTDMVFHRTNGKLLYLLSGKIKVSVLKDGVMNSVSVAAGSSFYVRPGLIYQLEAIDKAIAVEFAFVDTFKDDITCVVKGTQPQSKIAEAIQAVQTAVADAKKAEPEPAPVAEEKPAEEAPAPKKRQTRKKKGLN